eukprot:sb/3477625/
MSEECSIDFIILDELPVSPPRISYHHPCLYCSEKFLSATQLSDHVTTRHALECAFCEGVFRTMEVYFEHFKAAHSNQPLFCECCSRTFHRGKEFLVHLAKKTKKNG